jgi:hypothetical protein
MFVFSEGSVFFVLVFLEGLFFCSRFLFFWFLVSKGMKVSERGLPPPHTHTFSRALSLSLSLSHTHTHTQLNFERNKPSHCKNSLFIIVISEQIK